VMNHTSPLQDRRLGGANVHPAIDLHRVHRDDVCIEASGDFDGDFRLPSCRRAEQSHNSVQSGLPTR